MESIERCAPGDSRLQAAVPASATGARAPARTGRWWNLADRVGATASFLCAIHCALLPFVLTLLPLVGLGFLASHGFERGFVAFAVMLAMVALVIGYRRHRRALPLLLAVPGLALLLAGIAVVDSHTPLLHSVLVTCGGLLVASAHFSNLYIDRRLGGTAHGAACAH
jgi:hypothetical protein